MISMSPALVPLPSLSHLWISLEPRYLQALKRFCLATSFSDCFLQLLLSSLEETFSTYLMRSLVRVLLCQPFPLKHGLFHR